ncbi:MAG TPA: glycosyltransferase [Pseudonocardia sp.]|jgi:hypothetical protein|nr:glycosyltransferase [Pseudonocardia sp.]
MRCSIVINNCNYARYLERCVSSALAQTIAAEVIVVDDGSADASREVLEKFGDAITCIYQENSGQATAMNVGVAAATGDIVAFLDSDDWAYESKVDEILRAFEGSPNGTWLRHNLALSDGDQVLAPTSYDLPRRHPPVADYLRWGITVGETSCIAFRRDFLTNEIGKIPALYSTYADSYLKLSAALLGQCIDCPRSLGVRRLHGGQASRRRNGTPERVTARIRHRKANAERAAEIGGQTGRRELASAGTWWQQRALLHELILESPRASSFTGWLRYVASLHESDLSSGSKFAFAAREGLLVCTPRPIFPRAWWSTNDGRRVLRRAHAAVR